MDNLSQLSPLKSKDFPRSPNSKESMGRCSTLLNSTGHIKNGTVALEFTNKVAEDNRRLQAKQLLAVQIFKENKINDENRKIAVFRNARETRILRWTEKTANSALAVNQVHVSDIQQLKIKQRMDNENKRKHQSKLLGGDNTSLMSNASSLHLERISAVEDSKERLALQYKYLQVQARVTKIEYKHLNTLIAEEKVSLCNRFPKLASKFESVEPQSDDASSSSDFGYLRYPQGRLEDSSYFDR